MVLDYPTAVLVVLVLATLSKSLLFALVATAFSTE